MKWHNLICRLAVLLSLLCLIPFAWSDVGLLQVLVQDAHRHPVKGVGIGVEGSGGSRTSGDDEKALLSLSKDTAENDWVSLQLVHSPPGKDLVIVSPFDNRTPVPSFKDKPENFVRVIVIERGDFAALQDGTIVASLTAKINKANATSKKVGALPSDGEDQRSNLEKVARLYGLKTEDLDEAIRSWGARTTDPYDVGLAALYERDYPRATGELKEALKTREAKLAQDQKAVVNAAFVLGKSFYKQGKYRDAVTAYERCLQLSPGDTTVVNNLAVSLHDSGDFARAEPLYRRALAIDEKALGPEHPDVAISLNNLASLSKDKGDYAGAEPLLRRALAIDEKALGPEHPNVAAGLNNLGLLLGRTGDYAGAEPLLRRALAIDEKALGPEHPDVAIDLSNLVSLLQGNGDYAGAEPLLRRALAIQERRLGLDNPTTIKIRNNLEALHRLDAQAKKK